MKTFKFVFLGVVYAMLWSSASVAAKLGLESVQPLVLYQARLVFAGVALSLGALLLYGFKLPTKVELKQLAIYGFLAGTVYLGLFVVGINKVAAGLGPLFVALNPIIMVLIGSVMAKAGVKISAIVALIFGVGGILLAAFPLFSEAYVSVDGLLILSFCMFVYSIASLYFGKCKWSLDFVSINAWQTVIGCLLLFPFTIYFYEGNLNTFSQNFWLSSAWMGVVISGLGVNIWLQLLQDDPQKASYFMFLSPIFGFVYAAFILGEPFTIYTLGGLVLVIAALAISQFYGKKV